MRLHERLLIAACAHSYRFRCYARFTASLPCGRREARVPIIRGLGWNLLKFQDQRIQRIVSKLYSEGRGCFVDVGANQGQMILNVLALDLDLCYLGFEPDLSSVSYIQELIRVNRLKNYHILPIALGSANSNLRLHRKYPADVTATLGFDLYPSHMYTETALVPVSTADDQLGSLEHPIFLVKIDTEGWELHVLHGMECILRQKRPPVYFEVMGYRHLIDGSYSREFHGGDLSRNELQRLIENRRHNMSSLRNFWQERGYTAYLCREDGTLHRAQSLDPGCDSDDNRGEMNYLAIANELMC
jgi:FkbM family methyltransferase